MGSRVLSSATTSLCALRDRRSHECGWPGHPEPQFGLERPSGHADEGGGVSDFCGTLEVVEGKEEVLSLDPPNRGGEPVSKGFYKLKSSLSHL